MHNFNGQSNEFSKIQLINHLSGIIASFSYLATAAKSSMLFVSIFGHIFVAARLKIRTIKFGT